MKSKPHGKHQNQVRISGGFLRGRKISFAAADGLRPTPDSVRERLFNWLGQDLSGQTVLDLFAGSGALGFEAASRHAKRVVMYDIRRETVRNLKSHIALFGIQAAVSVEQSDALTYLQHSRERFDLVLLDPPFAWNGWPQLLNILPERLNSGAWVYLEAGSLPELPPCFHLHREGRAGQSRQLLLKFSQTNELQ